MPQQAWSNKRERQYEHIKDSAKKRGKSEDTAEEIAARTVNKERARSGEAKTSSRLSREDMSSGKQTAGRAREEVTRPATDRTPGGDRGETPAARGHSGMRSHRGEGGRTRDQLYEEAKRKNIRGRSSMTKAELQRAVDR